MTEKKKNVNHKTQRILQRTQSVVKHGTELCVLFKNFANFAINYK
jgi:hypothetical protein